MVHLLGSSQCATEGSRVLQAPIDLDRSRKVRFRETARKPAPMLDPDGLTVRMTVRMTVILGGAEEIFSRDNDLHVPLIIDWE